jgi:hypothetical protein
LPLHFLAPLPHISASFLAFSAPFPPATASNITLNPGILIPDFGFDPEDVRPGY